LRNYIIYGGTFDPIHNGHINTAINIQNHFNFDRFLFLPCKTPLLKRNAIATPAQRVDMIELALAHHQDKHFAIDLSEINRDSPSYMIESLQQFRTQFSEDSAITLLMGSDIFNELPQWHAWQRLLTLANLLIIKRAGFDDSQFPDLVKELLIKHETHHAKAICKQAHGLIYRYDAGSFNFSSSWIRKQFAAGKDLRGYLPESVLEYMEQNKLYRAR
jgi:nicotinate-nucleotide adenylyltransferase